MSPPPTPVPRSPSRLAAGPSPARDGRGLLAGTLALAAALSLAAGTGVAAQVDPYAQERRAMVENQLRKRGIEAPGVLAAMESVPRHAFVPEEHRRDAYADAPVLIAPGQTLSQAYLSGLMFSLLELRGGEKVLEVGTGTGYDAAVLSRIAGEVHTIEIDAVLAARARDRLRRLGYRNVYVHVGDGYRGLPEEAPFDAIVLTTAPDRIPEPLFDQLKEGGRLVVAVGGFVQDLQVITKTASGRKVRKISPVRLGPMSGEVARGGG